MYKRVVIDIRDRTQSIPINIDLIEFQAGIQYNFNNIGRIILFWLMLKLAVCGRAGHGPKMGQGGRD